MSRLSAVVVLSVSAVALVVIAVVLARKDSADAGSGPELRLDFDLAGGACTTIEDSLTLQQGTYFDVGVCFNNPEAIPVAAFQ